MSGDQIKIVDGILTTIPEEDIEDLTKNLYGDNIDDKIDIEGNDDIYSDSESDYGDEEKDEENDEKKEEKKDQEIDQENINQNKMKEEFVDHDSMEKENSVNNNDDCVDLIKESPMKDFRDQRLDY